MSLSVDQLNKPIRDILPSDLTFFANCTNEKAQLIPMFMNLKQENRSDLIKFAVEELKLPFDEPDENNNSKTPLMHAFSKKFYEIANNLIKSGADLRKKDRNGKSAFVYLCETSCSDELFNETLNGYKLDANDCLAYLKFCESKRMDRFEKILRSDPIFWPLSKQFIETNGWDIFFSMFREWRFSISHDYAVNYLLPLFCSGPVQVINYISCSKMMIPVFGLLHSLEKAGYLKLIDALWSLRTELFALTIEFADEKSTIALKSYWMVMLSSDHIARIY